MRQFMVFEEFHKAAMPHLVGMVADEEASLAHWTQPEAILPSWMEADKRMREGGRSSKVRNPSPQHVSLSYSAPYITTAAGEDHSDP